MNAANQTEIIVRNTIIMEKTDALSLQFTLTKVHVERAETALVLRFS